MKALKTLSKYLLITVGWVLVWWGISAIVGNPIIFPAPSSVLLRAFELAMGSESATFWLSILYSIIRIVFGLICAIAAAVLTSAVAFRFKPVESVLKPLITVIKSTPLVSFIFIAYIAFIEDQNPLPSFIAGLIVFPVIYDSILSALKRTPKELIEVSDVFGCSFYERLRYLWVPSALPSFITASKTSIGLAWKAGVAAEALVAIPTMISIGTELSQAKKQIETADQFAWTLVIILLSLMIEILFSALAKKLTDKIL